jgi:hypothetical protein
MQFNTERVRQNAQQASTEDLLDRVTVYRTGMEPEAVDIIESELSHRGVGRKEIEEHLSRRRAGGVSPLSECVSPLVDASGLPLECSFCHRPAVLRRRGWDWMRPWGVPLFPRPRLFYYCEQHRPDNAPQS